MRRYGYSFMTIDEGDAIGTHYRAFIIFFGFVIAVLGSLWFGLFGYASMVLFCMFVHILLSMISEAYPKTGLILGISAALIFAVTAAIETLFFEWEYIQYEYGYWGYSGSVMWIIFNFSIAVFALRLLRAHKRKTVADQE